MSNEIIQKDLYKIQVFREVIYSPHTSFHTANLTADSKHTEDQNDIFKFPSHMPHYQEVRACLLWNQIHKAPAPCRKLEWCQSSTELILALLKRSAGYLINKGGIAVIIKMLDTNTRARISIKAEDQGSFLVTFNYNALATGIA